jgi:hypothetical protein
MRITFVVKDLPETHRWAVQLTVWQMAPRLGIPFSIVSNEGSAPSDSVIIFVSPQQPSNKNLLQLADQRILQQEAAKSVHHNGSTLWTVGKADVQGLFAGLVNLVTFSHEENLPKEDFDSFGRIISGRAPLTRQDVDCTPLIEYNIQVIRSWLQQVTGQTIPLPYPWGKGRSALVFTHDIDGPRLHSLFALGRSAILGFGRNDRLERASFLLGALTKVLSKDDPYWNFENWLSLENSLGGQSTFFFYARDPAERRHSKDPRYDIRQQRYRRTLPAITASGGDVGLHIPILGCNARAIASSTALLRECGATDVLGARAHYWAIDWRNPFQSWQEINRGGLSYDLSLTPLKIGLRNGSVFPLLPLMSDTELTPRPFTVTSTAIMDAYTFRHETNIDTPVLEQAIADVIRETAQHRGVLVLDWHGRTFSNVGRWRGYLSRFLEVALPLANDDRWRILTANQLHRVWLEYVQKLWVGPYELGW